MKPNLSKEALLACFSSGTTYKNAKPFLEQFSKANIQVIEVISQLLKDILMSKAKYPPLTKLFALKFFKELFLTGNFEAIDELDDEIERAIYSIAAYKRNSKDPTRGESYFIEVDKQPDTPENKQLSLSFHVLAMDIVKACAEFLPFECEGQVSRFAEYYETLIKQGVAFPPNYSYIKIPQEKERFLKNYSRWIGNDPQADVPPKVPQKKQVNEIKPPQPQISPPKHLQKQDSPKNKVPQPPVVKKEDLAQKPKQVSTTKEIETKQAAEIIQLKKQVRQLQEVVEVQKDLNQTLIEQQDSLKKQNKKLLDKIKNVEAQLSKIRELSNAQEKQIRKLKIQLEEKYGLQRNNSKQIIQLQKLSRRQIEQVTARNHQLSLQKKKIQDQVQILKQKVKMFELNKLEEKVRKQQAKQQRPTTPIQKLIQIQKTQPKKQLGHSIPRTQNTDPIPKRPPSARKAKFLPSPRNLSQQMNLTNYNRQSQQNTSFKQRKLSDFLRQKGQRKQDPISIEWVDSKPTTRASIFGLRSVEGLELHYSRKFSASPYLQENEIFKKVCILERGKFFYNDSISLSLSKLGATNEFHLRIQSKLDRAIELAFEIQKKPSYDVNKIQFCAYQTLPPLKRIDQKFTISVTSLQLQFPEINIGVGEKRLTLDLPITILNFCRFLRPNKPNDCIFRHPQSIKSECIEIDLSDNKTSVPMHFSKFLKVRPQQFEGSCIATFIFDKRILVKLSIVGFGNKCIFQATFESDHQESSQFAAELLQTLMFCFKKHQEKHQQLKGQQK